MKKGWVTMKMGSKKRERAEYTINQRIEPVAPCSRCGGATILTKSVFIPGVDVISCASLCFGSVTEEGGIVGPRNKISDSWTATRGS